MNNPTHNIINQSEKAVYLGRSAIHLLKQIPPSLLERLAYKDQRVYKLLLTEQRRSGIPFVMSPSFVSQVLSLAPICSQKDQTTI